MACVVHSIFFTWIAKSSKSRISESDQSSQEIRCFTLLSDIGFNVQKTEWKLFRK
ncbi:hypothetical protein LEP1GSC116_4312 [Leptospira interrogans serovar Icterohaemorrhagiae str. Verdun HP]|uniref:Uncharacterized protein n=6 Tax=Leptospira interrogans TaxID=173 RepID=M3GY83_LEPIR|nr:hypothetical protein LEP1GSC148_1512 [Leptospira interrogans serovar Canicola str. LT1962]EMG11663.1 hypothetical protein LEP1GSC151_2403 [Leptospira interrogans serovar Grippotyphosa str. LT2186]EMG19751.1 hypothetical protein LEP1GSC150_3206 [Leptospira interrogans serovar Copenhageni str. LT2050]EMM79941.1 hypothetical protein LEP1GSC037_3944 [Leptospira interrogans str. 2006001854]EMM95211.1 hypothetical protein LEP1GSC158_0931 [Leptospira interrogans serovar Zanoni str. LT2156]EMO04996